MKQKVVITDIFTPKLKLVDKILTKMHIFVKFKKSM